MANYLQAIDQLTVTTLRNLIGSMDLESTLTSRETINTRLREVLDEATGKWGIRVNRVEIKAIDPPHTIKEAMEKQMRAERDKRAVILHAEGERQSLILTAEGTRNKLILEAQGRQQAMILESDGEAKALERVFQAVHANDADPKVLAYKYLEMLPQLAEHGNGYFVIPGELTEAVKTVTSAFAADHGASGTASSSGNDAARGAAAVPTQAVGPIARPRAIEAEAARAAEMARGRGGGGEGRGGPGRAADPRLSWATRTAGPAGARRTSRVAAAATRSGR